MNNIRPLSLNEAAALRTKYSGVKKERQKISQFADVDMIHKGVKKGISMQEGLNSFKKLNIKPTIKSII